MRSLLPAAYCQQPCSCSKPTHSAPRYFAIPSLLFHLDVKPIILKASLWSEQEWFFQPYTRGNWNRERRPPVPRVIMFVLPCNVAVMGLGPSTACWMHTLEEKNLDGGFTAYCKTGLLLCWNQVLWLLSRHTWISLRKRSISFILVTS